MPDAAPAEAIQAVPSSRSFHGDRAAKRIDRCKRCKAWARLRMNGVRTSLRRMLRLPCEHDPLAPSRVGVPHGRRNHDGTVVPGTVNTSPCRTAGQASNTYPGSHAARTATFPA